MSSPDNASLETLSLTELRERVGTLLAKVAELGSVIGALKAENQALRDELARLKGLPPRPKASMTFGTLVNTSPAGRSD